MMNKHKEITSFTLKVCKDYGIFNSDNTLNPELYPVIEAYAEGLKTGLLDFDKCVEMIYTITKERTGAPTNTATVLASIILLFVRKCAGLETDFPTDAEVDEMYEDIKGEIWK